MFVDKETGVYSFQKILEVTVSAFDSTSNSWLKTLRLLILTVPFFISVNVKQREDLSSLFCAYTLTSKTLLKTDTEDPGGVSEGVDIVVTHPQSAPLV